MWDGSCDDNVKNGFYAADNPNNLGEQVAPFGRACDADGLFDDGCGFDDLKAILNDRR